MDFTREPIIETIITPREGYRLVVRSSKNVGQEEYFVDAIEVVSFGNAFFFRSLERPKSFVVPATDYEILEVREPRMVLKTAQGGSAVKIGAQREGGAKLPREREPERKEAPAYSEGEREFAQEEAPGAFVEARESREGRGDKRRDRRRGFRRRRGMREETQGAAQEMPQEGPSRMGQRVPQGQPQGQPQGIPTDQIGPRRPEEMEMPSETEAISKEMQQVESKVEPTAEPTLFRSILPPPTTLIRDDLQRLRESDVYRGAFYIREEGAEAQDDDDQALESLREENKDKGASSQEEPFLFSQAMDQEIHPNHPQDVT